MNACEDETEPLGESPAIDTLSAINRAADAGMLSEADKATATATAQLAERQAQALSAVRDIHFTVTSGRYAPYCHMCRYRVPCPTIRAIDEAGA